MITLPTHVDMDIVTNDSVYEANLLSNESVHQAELVSNDKAYEAKIVTDGTYAAEALQDPLVLDLSVVNAIKINGGFPEYAGAYEVIPSAKSDITLNTKDKVCVDNITVNKITKFETANPGGGYTLYIAEME